MGQLPKNNFFFYHFRNFNPSSRVIASLAWKQIIFSSKTKFLEFCNLISKTYRLKTIILSTKNIGEGRSGVHIPPCKYVNNTRIAQDQWKE